MRFALTTAGLATVTLAGTATGVTVDFTHDMDRWAGEHAWQVHSSGGATVASMFIASSSLYYGGCSNLSITTYSSVTSHFATVTGNMDLAAGTYHVAMQDSYSDGWAWGSFVGSLSINGEGASFPNGASASFSFTVVPAPGAMALLGLAGLAARRRRRD
ncbi:MAG: hypothetical protein HOO04_04335 [Phycisphaerae bacterium]|jgi:MYXO-CTERM domain-containing protein|nr:hypothetical protein [Phycisphaerae bacterium]